MTADLHAALALIRHTAVFAGEARLLRWSESSANGKTVTFEIEDDSPAHPFKSLSVGKSGARFHIIAIGIGEDEQPVAPMPTPVTDNVAQCGGTEQWSPSPNPQPKRAWVDLRPSQQAGMLCHDPVFWKFLSEIPGTPEISDGAMAATVLRRCLRISSRADLDTPGPYAQAWAKLSSAYFVWKNEPMEEGR